jgi:hypothetical protein
VGQAASSLKEMLTGIAQEPDEKVTFDTFAGQANVRLWAQASTEAELAERLARLKQEALLRLGDHVYGEGEIRLENAILDALRQHQRQLVLAECNTNQILANTWQRLLPEGGDTITAVATNTPAELADYLQIEPYQPDDDLTQWCRTVAETLLAQTNSDLSLLVYKNILPGGVQILVTLASPQGASVTNRSFGGHPDYIDEWSITLGLTHLRRWLLVHH